MYSYLMDMVYDLENFLIQSLFSYNQVSPYKLLYHTLKKKKTEDKDIKENPLDKRTKKLRFTQIIAKWDITTLLNGLRRS